MFKNIKIEYIKLVIKKKTFSYMLLYPERYESMVEALEDYALYIEAEKRMKVAKEEGFMSEEELLNELGITKADLEDIEVEIE